MQQAEFVRTGLTLRTVIGLYTSAKSGRLSGIALRSKLLAFAFNRQPFEHHEQLIAARAHTLLLRQLVRLPIDGIHQPRTTIRVITSVKPAAVNKDAATSKNKDVLENSRVFRVRITCRTANRSPATTNRVGHSGLTLIGIALNYDRRPRPGIGLPDSN